MSERPRILLAMPAGNRNPDIGAGQAFWHTTTKKLDVIRLVASGGGSMMSLFNRCLAAALGTPGVSHLAILHTDVCPDPWWLDTLYDEMEATRAAVMSAIVPIKNDRGVTSTAAGYPWPSWWYDRLTMAEVMALPETITIADLPPNASGCILLVNTGCMLIDLRHEWWGNRDYDDRLQFCFRMEDRITRLKSGSYAVEFWPEDWRMSQYAAACGGVVAATRKVRLYHGSAGCRNDRVWGTDATDVQSAELFRILRGEDKNGTEAG